LNPRQYEKQIIRVFFGEVAPTIKSGQLLVHPLHNTNNISIHNYLFAKLAEIHNQAVSPTLGTDVSSEESANKLRFEIIGFTLQVNS